MVMFTPEAKNTIHIATNGRPSGGPAATQVLLAPAVTGTAPSNHAQMRYLFAAYVLVVGGALLGWGLDAWVHPAAPVVVQGLSVFAVLYVAAQAIERTIEPITEWTGTVLGGVKAPREDVAGGETKDTAPDQPVPDERMKSKAELKNRRAQAIQTARSRAASGQDPAAQRAAHVAAISQAGVEQDRRNSTVLVWGIATFLGILVSGWIGLALLRSVGVQSAPRVLDIIVTGLAIGGGSKPLHDLISNLQASKEQKKDPADVKPA